MQTGVQSRSLQNPTELLRSCTFKEQYFFLRSIGTELCQTGSPEVQCWQKAEHSEGDDTVVFSSEIIPSPTRSDPLSLYLFCEALCLSLCYLLKAWDNYLVTFFLPSLSLCSPSNRPPRLGITPHPYTIPSWNHPQPSPAAPST